MGAFRVTIEVGDPRGERFVPLEALVDTGSTYTWVPGNVLAHLGVMPQFAEEFETADGRIIVRNATETRIRIDGRERTTVVVFGDEGTEALLGVVTLETFRLAADPIRQRLVPVRGLAKAIEVPQMAQRLDLGARLTFDMSRPGRLGCTLPPLDVPKAPLPPSQLLRSHLNLPEVAENEIVRYFLALSRLNYSVDTGFYPLGSCTMKYNPKINEDVARLPGFALAHPLQPAETVQGALAVLFRLQEMLAEITGMDAVSLAPAAGAQGELCGILMVKSYLADRGEEGRGKVLVPDSAHGTNPATAAMCGFQVVTVPSDRQGNTDLTALAAALDDPDEVGAMMLTLPSTLGLFDPHIGRIAETLHRKGALLYGDGANQNAFLGRARFGDMGFDVVHLNLHKTFSTPHGGGGPGAGPICVKAKLAPYLPAPIVERQDGRYVLATPERSIGRTMAFHGNFGVLLRAYTYIRSLGGEGLRAISENAVINANYVLARLKEAPGRAGYHLPYHRRCMHEVVFSGSRQRPYGRPFGRAKGVRTMDIAKRLIDYGFHPPTIYFPLIVEEALMIEPTETESKESLDAFCQAMLAIAREAEETPELVRGAPYTAPLRRLDEATAARKPVLRWRPPTGRDVLKLRG